MKIKKWILSKILPENSIVVDYKKFMESIGPDGNLFRCSECGVFSAFKLLGPVVFEHKQTCPGMNREIRTKKAFADSRIWG